MDQRRVVAFLSLSFLVLMLHSMFFAPKPEPRKELLPDGGAQQAEQPQRAEPRGADDAPPAGREGASADSIAAEPGVPEGNRLDPEADEPATIDLEYVTLGSVAEDGPYRLLVTFTTSGAGVRRIELASSRFRDLHDRGGYLGSLELQSEGESGLLVGSVGAGTPAEAAGLQKGDRLLSVMQSNKRTRLSTPQEFAVLLSQAEPGEQLNLEVARGGDPPQDLIVTLARRPLEVIRPESENVLMRTGKLPPDLPAPPSFQFTFERLGATKIGQDQSEIAGVQLREANWEIKDRNATSVTFRRRLPQHDLEVLKRYSLEPIPADSVEDRNYPGYGLKLHLEIRNLGARATEVAYQLDGPNGLPLEGWWYANKIGRNWGAGGIRDVVALHVGNDTVQFSPSDIAEGEVEPMQGNPLVYVGVDAQYFAAMLLPMKENLDEAWIDEARSVLIGPKPKARSSDGRFANVTCRLISHRKTVESGQSLQHSYEIFTGPKRPELLAKYQASGNPLYTLSDLMYYGWFGPVAKAMLGILHFFYGIVGNYGIAIVLLTVLVRSCMFPISRKQAQSMARMQELKPEMDKLKEKYKGDNKKQSQAMQELYRKHQINPLAGCLPMFIQLPIFLGLYRALMVDVELRQAPLLGDAIFWCSNLAAPDMFLNWSRIMPDFISSGDGIMGLGPYLNVLPLVTVGLFLLQQSLFMPEAANEQAALQQKIMKFMMLFMGLLFFKVASGLCLYFIASSTWGIAERKMLPKPSGGGSTAATEPAKPPPTRASSNGQPKNNRSNRAKKKNR